MSIFVGNVRGKMSILDLGDKHIWITGGGGAIGSAFAKLCAAQGARVTLTGRNRETLSKIAAQDQKITYVAGDITDQQQIMAIIADLPDIDIAFLNAGAYQPGLSSQTEIPIYQQLMDINYFGTLYCLIGLRNKAKDRPIHVAVNGSLAGYCGLPNASGYGASKAALINLVESWHSELQGSGFRVQLINPGFVRSELTAQNKFKMPDLLTADQAANFIYQGLQSYKFEITFPRMFALKMKFLRHLPYPLYFKAMGKLMKDLNNG